MHNSVSHKKCVGGADTRRTVFQDLLLPGDISLSLKHIRGFLFYFFSPQMMIHKNQYLENVWYGSHVKGWLFWKVQVAYRLSVLTVLTLYVKGNIKCCVSKPIETSNEWLVTPKAAKQDVSCCLKRGWRQLSKRFPTSLCQRGETHSSRFSAAETPSSILKSLLICRKQQIQPTKLFYQTANNNILLQHNYLDRK